MSLAIIAPRCETFVEDPPQLNRPTFVYFLIHRDAIVYVGRTINLSQRMRVHRLRLKRRDRYRIAFDRVLFRQIESDFPDVVEGALIRALRPRYNVSAPRYRGGDNAVLTAFGLSPHVDEAEAARDFPRWLDAHPVAGQNKRNTRRGIVEGRRRRQRSAVAA